MVPGGGAIYYRRVKVGEIRDFQLAPTFEKVYLNVIIYEQFKLLICENTRFWNGSGIQLSGGIFSRLSLSIESLESLVVGGIALATPAEEEMEAFVKSGHHFRLYGEAEESWRKWQPNNKANSTRKVNCWQGKERKSGLSKLSIIYASFIWVRLLALGQYSLNNSIVLLISLL